MTDHDVERLDKAIERLTSRLECVEQTHREQHNAIWRLEDKVQRLEIEISRLMRGEMRRMT